MASCYSCGRTLRPDARQSRRRVRTGEWERRGRDGVRRGPLTVRFGMRVVCPWCRKRIDREAARRELLQYAELEIAIAVLLAGLALRLLRG